MKNKVVEDNSLFLAVDGGGTKTIFLVFDKEGRIYSTQKFGPSNPNDVSSEVSLNLLKDGIKASLKKIKNIKYVFAGVAGVETGDNIEVFNRELAKEFPNLKIVVDRDLYNLVEMDKTCDMCLILGTGVSLIAHGKDDQYHQIGGWGYLLDDAGSGYDLGKSVLKTVLDERESKLKYSLITKNFEKKYKLSNSDLIFNIYQKGKSYVASFAHMLIECYKDPKAQAILLGHAKYVANQIKKAKRLYGCNNNVLLSGGIVEHDYKQYLDLIKNLTKANFKFIKIPQIYGACKHCVGLFGTYTKKFDDSLVKSLKALDL